MGLKPTGSSLGAPLSKGSRAWGSNGANSAEAFYRQGVLPRFGDYELESEIARGGMGVVYRARQKSLNRVVAIKMILAGQLATPESVQRFRLEAEAAAKLHHPGIVQIFEIGECETQHFFSMELVEGASLAECMPDLQLKAGATPAQRRDQEQCIAELIAQVARALQFAHQRGVLHRDLKPSNILIDEAGHPRLTDFGLAKLTGRETSGLTLSTAVLGTPGYLAPEQAAGQAEQVTTAADVYGLGATLYELLTGYPPFTGATAVETMLKAIKEPPAAPRKLNPTVHRDLETIALRCLEKQPERRYRSAESVAEDLERFVRREPIQARPVSRLEHAWRWCQRNPWLALMACALAVAILMGGSTALWQWMRAQQANVTLTENLEHLEWDAIDTMLERDQSSRALAKVAGLVRANPEDPKAAMFAMSVMEQKRFPLPVAPPIRHPDGAELTVARLSPDGTRIVTASFDKTARLWDTATSESTSPPLEHEGAVAWAEFSPGGATVATCSDDKTVRLWDAATGKAIGEPCQFGQRVQRIQFSPDGRYLLARMISAVAILDGRDLQIHVEPIPHAGRVVAARFLSNGLVFFTAQQAGDNSQLRAWDVATGEELDRYRTGNLRDADLTNDLAHCVTLEGLGEAWIADFPSGENRQSIPNHEGQFYQCRFDATGDRIALVSGNQWAGVWNTHTGLPVTRELTHYYLLEGAAFLDGGERLLTWSDDSLAQVWNVATSEPYCEPMRHTNRVIHAETQRLAGQEVFLTTMSHLKSRSVDTQTGSAQVWRVPAQQDYCSRSFGTDPGAHDGERLSSDGRLVAIARTSQQVFVYDGMTGELVCGPLAVKGGAWGLLLSPDSKRLAATTSRGQVSVWSLPDGELVNEPHELPTTYQPAEMSAGGEVFITGSTDGFARVWDLATGRPIREMKHGSEINSVALSPDGSRLASAGENRVVRVWDAVTGELLHELTGHKNEVMEVQFSPDGRRLVSASLDFTARLWDAVAGRELAVLPHQGEVIDAVFSADNRWIATASRDRTAVIWEAATGRPHSRNLLHEQGVRNVQFSPDSQHLLTLDFRGLRLWDVATCHPLTVHLPHQIHGGTGFQGSTSRPDFTVDGERALVGADSELTKLWHFSTPAGKAPKWFPELLEAVAGQRFAVDADLPEYVPPDAYLKLQNQLRESHSDDDYTRWARRWLFGWSSAEPSAAAPAASRSK